MRTPFVNRTPRAASAAVAAVVIGLSAGCAGGPGRASADPPRPLDAYLADAARARAEHQSDRERELYREAARAYPAAAQPWTGLASSHFADGDPGSAIVAAQEALHRDPADVSAAGLLAVAGLRVSTQAIASLRDVQQGVPAGTRVQAQELARTLRDLVGEPQLVPAPVRKPAPRSIAAAAATGTPGAARPQRPSASPAWPPVDRAARDRNPFDALR